MKKILLFCSVAAAVLSLASCERELLYPGQAGAPVALNLDLNLSGMATKAFGDGSQVDQLYVGVYDADGNYLSELSPADPVALTSGSAAFNATLTIGESYKIAFWAQKSETGNYTVDLAKKTITANYTENTQANDDSFDAFYALYETGSVTEAINAEVTLKRPFAQLNVFTPEANVTEAAGRTEPLTIASAGMTVSAVKNVLNPFDGSLSGSQDVTFAPAACSETTILADYKYVEMNYIFADASEANKTVSVSVYFTGVNDPQVFNLSNVPVRPNRRTNIRGNVFPAAEPAATTADLSLTVSLGASFDEEVSSVELEEENQGGYSDPTVYTSTFTSAKWESTGDFGWTSGKDGAGFSNNGIQVTSNGTGANGTTDKTFTNVSKVVVTYNTNASKGAGTLDLKVGDNAASSNNWAYSGSASGSSANFTCEFDVESQSGAITLTANTTTNSIYIVSVAVTAESISQ